jgi:hypothetical protein
MPAKKREAKAKKTKAEKFVEKTELSYTQQMEVLVTRHNEVQDEYNPLLLIKQGKFPVPTESYGFNQIPDILSVNEAAILVLFYHDF